MIWFVMKAKHGRVLVVIEDQTIRDETVERLAGPQRTIETASEWGSAIEIVERAPPDLVLTSFDPGDVTSFEVLKRIRALAPDATLVVIIEALEASSAVSEAIRRGADHCLTRPIRPDAVAVLLDRALKKAVAARKGTRAVERVSEHFHIGHFQRTIGSHPSMQLLLQRALQAAETKATILIYGETGTGKELIASGIHEHSKRREGNFVKLNCASLAETILESELFGHEKGSFTGALALRRGKFEMADGGTLFLDEVSEIPSPIQVKLLRFLQDREFERVGGNQTLRVDVRVIAASNKDLSLLVGEGRFREDLYYRLNVVRLDVPPLRARPSDIPLLAEHFLRYYAREHDRDIRSFSRAAIDALLRHPWPGNVRALQNAVEQAVVMCKGKEIGIEDLPLVSTTHEIEPLRLMIPGLTLAELERYAILKTLDAVNGSTTKAASILGISRRTIQYRLKEWGLSRAGDSNEKLYRHFS
ncbi:MAG: sigma-54-dependent Fis family transcriptional regulator [Deltaproteobacteria bacterium]|nr:sigma-54-dependent Fis family transcriptional regulator [Deltaproteobacteria bacterium]